MSREYRFVIDAYSPDTIPMGRLAEYLTDLASLMGRRNAVHFVRLESGSLAVVHKVEHEDIPKVEQRLRLIGRGEGASDAARAVQALDKKLANDNAVGHLYGVQDAEIIRFPGRERPEPLDYGTVRQHGTIQGQLVRIGGKDITSHVILQDGDIYYSNCALSRDMARELSPLLYGPTIRMFGDSRWKRDSDGDWQLQSFKVESFEVLDDKGLSAAVSELRSSLQDRDTEGDLDVLDKLREDDPE